MANIKSAKKRILVNRTKADRNKAIKSGVKTSIKKVYAAIEAKDAEGAKTKEALLQGVIDTVGDKKSVVILMHDASDKILTYETLPDIIKYLRDNGYTFKTLYDIL